MKPFITLKDYSTEELHRIINRGIIIKQNQAAFSKALEDKFLYLLFQKTSTRTSLSFVRGIQELGGNYFIQNWVDTNFGLGDPEDEIRYVATSAHIIMARLKMNEDIRVMGEKSPVPVINGCCNRYHPCQAMADMITVKEKFGSFDVNFMYIGIHNNVLNSLIASLPRLGGKLYSLTPIINEPSLDEELIASAEKTGNYINLDKLNPKEIKEKINEMDIIYTDSWVDMEFFTDDKFKTMKEERVRIMNPYQLNKEFLKDSKAKVMHDMPMHPGYEISREVIEENIDLILAQADNRKHAQKSILVELLKDKKTEDLFAPFEK